MKRSIPASIAAQAEAFLNARHGWSGGLDMMAVTRPSDVPDWNPGVVEAAFYDRLDEPTLTLTSLAARYNDLNGKPGDTIRIPTDTVTTPAANLAVDVPAVDDALGSDAYEFSIKEAVKSIAWYDRTQVQSGQNVNDLAGRKVGTAVEERVELDLGAALIAGRNTAKDAVAGAVTWDLIQQMRMQIPSRLRKRGLVLVADDAVLGTMFSDPLVKDASKFGSDEAIRRGEFTGPILGVNMFATDDDVLPDVTVAAAAGRPLVMFARGMLAYGFQKNPSAEQERDARARLTRWVGTALHGEGTLEAAGIVVRRIP